MKNFATALLALTASAMAVELHADLEHDDLIESESGEGSKKTTTIMVDGVSQSSTYPNTDPNWILTHKFSPYWKYNTGSCTHTSNEAGHWLKFHLEHETHVRTVKLLNRRDCCGNEIDGHEVWVGEHKCGTLFESK